MIKVIICLILFSGIVSGCGNGPHSNKVADVVECEMSDTQCVEQSVGGSRMEREREFVDVLSRVTGADSVAQVEVFREMFLAWAADSVALEELPLIAAHYLDNPNSPVRDEEMYISFLRAFLDSEVVTDHQRQRAEFELQRCNKNRPGQRAADFRYVERDGTSGKLSTTLAPLLLLVFFDPECTHCSEILETLSNNQNLGRMLAEGRLRVLAVYAEGKMEVWEKHKNDLPSTWTVARDAEGILEKELYDLPAMPTLYLLDSTKSILQKDPAISELRLSYQ